MTTWHRECCKRPDVYPAGDSCHCSNCDTLAPLDQVVLDKSRFIPAIPKSLAYEEIHFVWPESVRFLYGQDIHLSASATEKNNLKATGECLCYTKVDKNPQHISSYPSKTRGFYTPLEATDQLRLLLLSRGKFDDPIHGTLMIARLGSNIKFQALSYTWADARGDDSRSKIIFLGPRWDMFMVTANCEAALRRLRRKDDDCMVWVDAICINQGNHVERNHQVGLMRRIYSAASEVFVYLGEASPLAKEAFERLMWAKKHQSIDEKGRQSLKDLFNMRYFSRIWIIQEIANAKLATIHLGDNAMGWSILEEERLKTLEIYNNAPKWISNIYLRQEYTTRDLSNLLFYTISSEASDPRDKLFALLGLVKDADEFGLAADYSLSLQEVQVGVAAFFITHEDDCSILRYAVGVSSDSPAEVPSWVPTWDRGYRSRPILRGSETFNSYVILRAEHIAPYVLSNPILDDLGKPRILHIGGYLSIQALKTIDLSRLTDFWGKYLSKGTSDQVSEFYAGLALLLDEEAHTLSDEIFLLKGCETIFHVRRNDPKSNAYKIVGVCNILLSLDRLNRDQNMNTSEPSLVSRFFLQNCPLERRHLQRMIELELLFKRLGCWDNDGCPSPDITVCESMFLDSIITRVLNAYIKEGGVGSTQSEPKIPDFQDDGTSSQLFLPIALQVQWLTTRRIFWESQASWKIVNAFGDIYSSYRSWRKLKAELEGILFMSLTGSWSLQALENNMQLEARNLANLTISLRDQLLLVAGACYIKQCQLHFGEVHLMLFRSNSSDSIERATSDDIAYAISNTFKEIHVNHYSRKKYLPGFQKIDESSFQFTDWDWGELETLFEPLKPFHLREIRDLQYACSLRDFLCKLQSQDKKWEWVTIV
jgi:hypothetical protein